MKNLILFVAVFGHALVHAKMPELEWSGDFRYRHENIDNGTIEDHNIQERIRARLQVRSEITKNVTITARLASGNGSITSTNQTLDGAGSNKNIDIDIFQADWEFADDATFSAGKMRNPMYTVGSSDIVFDSDITPEGLAVTYKKEHFFLNLGRFWIENVTAHGNDVMLYAPQAGVKFGAGPLDLTVGASWYNFAGLNRNVGNATMGNSSINNDYKILNAFFDASGKLNDLGYSVYFDYIKNSEVESADAGWLVGAKLSLKDWTLIYDYRWVGADATLDIFPDSDSAGDDSTGIYGHRTEVEYQFNKHVSTGASYYAHKIRSTKKHYEKYLADVVFKF